MEFLNQLAALLQQTSRLGHQGFGQKWPQMLFPTAEALSLNPSCRSYTIQLQFRKPNFTIVNLRDTCKDKATLCMAISDSLSLPIMALQHCSSTPPRPKLQKLINYYCNIADLPPLKPKLQSLKSYLQIFRPYTKPIPDLSIIRPSSEVP